MWVKFMGQKCRSHICDVINGTGGVSPLLCRRVKETAKVYPDGGCFPCFRAFPTVVCVCVQGFSRRKVFPVFLGLSQRCVCVWRAHTDPIVIIETIYWVSRALPRCVQGCSESMGSLCARFKNTHKRNYISLKFWICIDLCCIIAMRTYFCFEIFMILFCYIYTHVQIYAVSLH